MVAIDSVEILLVDDSESDAFMVQRAFQKANVSSTLRVIYDGEEALDYVFKRGTYAPPNAPKTPGLILLDVAMPRMDGFEVLSRLKQHPRYRRVPVIMLTTSERDEDVTRSYDHGACSYITKPASFPELVDALSQFRVYWTRVSRVPPPDEP